MSKQQVQLKEKELNDYKLNDNVKVIVSPHDLTGATGRVIGKSQSASLIVVEVMGRAYFFSPDDLELITNG